MGPPWEGSGTLVGDGDDEALPALGPAAGEDSPTGGGGHALTEPVGTLTALVVRLKSALRHV